MNKEPEPPPAYHRLAALLRALSLLVPAHRRQDWLREWMAELWFDLERDDRPRGLRSLWRLSGALPHALLIFTHDRSPTMLAGDFRFAVRSILRRPGFTLLAAGTLALGIGACTAMFTVVNTVLLRPLPYDHPDELVYGFGAFERNQSAAISPPDYLDYRERSRSFASLAAVTAFSGTAVLTGDGGPERVSAGSVSANFFGTLGVAPLLGRTFLPEEEIGEGHDVVILSHRLWQRRFGADPEIVGGTAEIGGRMSRVVGVMPSRLDRMLTEELWQPIAFRTDGTSVRRFHFLRIVGRLASGRSLAQAQAEFDEIARDLESTYPENATWRVRLVPLRDGMVGAVGPTLLVLFGAVLLVLLIACGNVASLLLARASARTAEMSLRAALGASRGQLVRQLLSESFVLALAGAAAGIALAAALVQGVRVGAAGMLPRLGELGLDVRVLAFAAGLAVATGLLFGLAPAVSAIRPDIRASLASTRSSGGRTVRRLRDVLVIAQVALSLVLLVGAGLLIRSVQALRAVDGGFEPEGVLTAQIQLPPSRYPTREVQTRFWTDLVERLRSVPGVASASATTLLPLVGGGDTYYAVEGLPVPDEASRPSATVSVVAPGYFDALSIPVVTGRALDERDRPGTPGAMLVNRSMAARLFPGESAVGQRFTVDFGEPFHAEIVGVVGDVLTYGLAGSPPDIMYFAHAQAGGFGRAFFNVVMQTRRDPLALIPEVRAVLATLDPDIPLAQPRTLVDVVDGSMGRQRFTTRLLGSFALLALVLAAVGLYGVLAWVVSQRRQELGIRIALGASSATVLRLVLRHGMGIVAIGLGLGIPASLLSSRLLAAQLFRVGSADPVVLASVSAVLLIAGLLASWLPARSAARASPLTVLRQELADP